MGNFTLEDALCGVGAMSDAVRMSGWVEKKALTATKNKWERRFMTLRGDTLSYYASDKEAAGAKPAKNSLQLTARSSVQTPAYFHPDEFEVTVGPGKVLYAYAGSKEESARWVAAIRAVVAELGPSKGARAVILLLWCGFGASCVASGASVHFHVWISGFAV